MKLRKIVLILFLLSTCFPGGAFSMFYPGGTEKLKAITNIGILITSEGDWISYLNEMGTQEYDSNAIELQFLLNKAIEVTSNKLISMSEEMKDKKDGFDIKKVVPLGVNLEEISYSDSMHPDKLLDKFINSAKLTKNALLMQNLDAVLELRVKDNPVFLYDGQNQWVENRLLFYFILKKIDKTDREKLKFTTIWVQDWSKIMNTYNPSVKNRKKLDKLTIRVLKNGRLKMIDNMKHNIESQLNEWKQKSPGSLSIRLNYTLLTERSISGIESADNLINSQYFGKSIPANYLLISHGFGGSLHYKFPYSLISLGINLDVNIHTNSNKFLTSGFDYIGWDLGTTRVIIGPEVEFRRKWGILNVISLEPAMIYAKIDHSLQIWDGVTNDLQGISAQGYGYAFFMNFAIKPYEDSFFYLKLTMGYSYIPQFKNDTGQILYQKQQNNHNVYYYANENSTLQSVHMQDFYLGLKVVIESKLKTPWTL